MEIPQLQDEDIEGLCTIQNEIIGISGTTVYQSPLERDLQAALFNREKCFSCLTIEDETGQAHGFQRLSGLPAKPRDKIDNAVPLSDGTPMDRIPNRYELS